MGKHYTVTSVTGNRTLDERARGAAITKGRRAINALRPLATLALAMALLLTLIPVQQVGASPSQLSGCTALMSQALRSRGACVTYLQEALNLYGYKLQTDGILGSQTEAAILSFQASHNLQRDGVVGPATRAALLASSVPTPKQPGPGSVRTPNPGPDTHVDCSFQCSLYLSRHTTRALNDLGRTEFGRTVQFAQQTGTCAVIGLPTLWVGGAACGLLFFELNRHGPDPVGKAVRLDGCLRIRFLPPVTVGVLPVITGVFVVQQPSDAGYQYCHD